MLLIEHTKSQPKLFFFYSFVTSAYYGGKSLLHLTFFSFLPSKMIMETILGSTLLTRHGTIHFILHPVQYT